MKLVLVQVEELHVALWFITFGQKRVTFEVCSNRFFHDLVLHTYTLWGSPEFCSDSGGTWVRFQYMFCFKFCRQLFQQNCRPVNKCSYYDNSSICSIAGFVYKVTCFTLILEPPTSLRISNVRILAGKKHRKIKLQRLQKIRIWIFGSLVHQINSF